VLKVLPAPPYAAVLFRRVERQVLNDQNLRRIHRVKDCVLLCAFHHQVVIHRWGWILVLNPDGTTTAWNKDKTKVLHSHGPPVRPG